MNLALNTLKKYTLKAQDGHIGHVKDILIDEDDWVVRWLVADTGNWLPGRKVLISPVSLGAPVHEEEDLPVSMTREDIEKAPSLDEDAPVSRKFEESYFHFAKWPYYWIGGGLWGNMTHPAYLNPHLNQEELDLETDMEPEKEQTVLRSGGEIQSYMIEIHGEDCGQVQNLWINPEDWSVPRIEFGSANPLNREKRSVSSENITKVSWRGHRMTLDSEADFAESAGQESVKSS